MTPRHPRCDHVGRVGHPPVTVHTFCEECLAEGVDDTDATVLRRCLTCGHVGCSEGSEYDHAGEHYAESDHAIALAVPPAPPSRWCYVHGRAV